MGRSKQVLARQESDVCKFCLQLVKVAKRLAAETGLPTLVMLRSHCVKDIPLFSGKFSRKTVVDRSAECGGVHYYFVENR